MSKEIFKLPVRVYYEDTDAGGIVYYANYLKFAERARTEYLRWGGFEQAEDLDSLDRYGFIVRAAEIEYIKPSKLDDLLEVSCEVEEVKGASIVCRQDITCNGELRVKVKVTAVYISLAKMRPMRVPEAMIKVFTDGK